MNEQHLAHVKIVVAMSIVGSSVVAGKLVVQSFPVFLAAELRFLIAAMLMVPLLIKLEGFPSVTKREMWLLFLQAVCGVFLFSIFMLYGLTLTTALEGGMIAGTLPVVTGVLSILLLKEKVDKNVLIGAGFAVVGTVIMHVCGADSSMERGASSLLGNLLIFGAVISEALFIICGKFVSQRVTPLAISTIVSFFGAVLFLPFSLYEGSRFAFTEVTPAEWGYILYFGIVVTAIAFILMYQGITKVSASTAGVLTGVVPISSAMLSVFLLGEEVSYAHLIGIGCIIAAIYWLARQSAKHTESVHG
ncbi:DMT family transporter [Aneurinibacillus sp. REN35]|uniref:DMT family transporter n=1 Tax=Aneurinibacillus sp. REN35 TaxID=3237286 RepID=UPI003527C912